MNQNGFIPSLNERICNTLKHHGWHLVPAEGGWFLNDRKVDTYYVIDLHPW